MRPTPVVSLSKPSESERPRPETFLQRAFSALNRAPYSFATRFGEASGTNPEELIAATHAGGYSMAFALILGNHGLRPTSIETQATCSIEPQSGGGFKITRVRLETRGEVPDIDNTQFQELAREAEAACPVSNALRAGVNIELHATLRSAS
jgi:lipoyl-dependent peroxiredoxin